MPADQRSRRKRRSQILPPLEETGLEFFLLNDLGTALVAAFCKAVIATVIANRVGARGGTATITVMRLDGLHREVRAANALTMSRLTAFGVCHDG